MEENPFIEFEIRRFQFVDRKAMLPLRYQIVTEIEKRIQTKRIKANEYLPTIRWLAAVNRVDPSTVARGYARLVEMKVIKADGKLGYRAL